MDKMVIQEQIIDRNTDLFRLFEEDMHDEHDHFDIVNASFYVDKYLNQKMLSVEEGIDYINDCFENFVVKHCWWTSPLMIRNVSESVRKFYESMLHHHIITDREYASVEDTVENCVETWIEDFLKKK